MEGRYTESGLFALKQAYDGYKFYLGQIDQCDTKISLVMNRIGNNKKVQNEGNNKNDKPQKRKPIRHHAPKVENLSEDLLNTFEGKDATLISGITDYTWLQLLSETGNDLTK